MGNFTFKKMPQQRAIKSFPDQLVRLRTEWVSYMVRSLYLVICDLIRKLRPGM